MQNKKTILTVDDDEAILAATVINPLFCSVSLRAAKTGEEGVKLALSTTDEQRMLLRKSNGY